MKAGLAVFLTLIVVMLVYSAHVIGYSSAINDSRISGVMVFYPIGGRPPELYEVKKKA